MLTFKSNDPFSCKTVHSDAVSKSFFSASMPFVTIALIADTADSQVCSFFRQSEDHLDKSVQCDIEYEYLKTQQKL